MEGFVAGWAAEWAKLGALGILSGILALAYWFKDRELSACRKEAQADSKIMTEALVGARLVLEKVADNDKDRLLADEALKGVLAALTQRIEMNDQLAKDRAERIVSALERRGGRGAQG